VSRRRKAPAGFDYQRYLASREWAVRKRAVRERAQGCCERCLLLPLAATHHLTYEHVGAEPLEDLQGVCKPCHAFESGLADFDPAEWARLVMVAGFAALGKRGPVTHQDRDRYCAALVGAAEELVDVLGVEMAERAIDTLRWVLSYVTGPVVSPAQFFVRPDVNLHLGFLRAAGLPKEAGVS